MMRFISQEFRTTLFLKFFGFLKVPMIFYCNPKVVRISEGSVEIKISLKRKTKNHVGSMYFGALSVGADITGGAIALDLIKKSKCKINLLFKNFKADFLKRAEGDVHFICNDGKLISDMVKKTEISTYISYGLTETCSGIAGSWAEDFYDTFIYKAHPGVSLSLSDAALQIISPVVVKKYFNSNRLFNNKFITSDCVEIIKKNQFKFIKRMDGIFISGGKNISLSYVKKHILKIEGIYSCDLKIIDDKRWGKVMHAALDVEENMNLKNIRQNLINVLPNYMVPKKMTIK